MRTFASLLICGFLLAGGSQRAHAQNLINRGTIINTGTIAVRDSVVGLPTTIGGKIRLTGENQLVPARSYQQLALTSPAVTTKWAEGNLYVSDTLLIGANVTFNIPADSAVTLGSANGRLTEQGYIAGKVTKSVDLLGSTTSSDFGGIGATVTWMGTPPGSTTVTRTSGTTISASGNNSIARYFDIDVTDPNIFADLSVNYSNDELGGQNPNTLDLWRLPPGETRWRRQRGSRSVGQFNASNIRTTGRFTIADASNPLDSVTAKEWDPALIASAGADSLMGSPGQSLPVSMRIVDAFGQGVSGVSVSFAITDTPVGAVGQTLTSSSVVTDTGGYVSTDLVLGGQSGRYEVTATVPSEVTIAARKFDGYAGSQLALMYIESGNGQSGRVRSLLSPLSVHLRDADDFNVVGYPVRFTITDRPFGDTSAVLSDTLVYSDANGIASVILSLGNRTGNYVVHAAPFGVDSLEQFFMLTAVSGPPVAFTPPAGIGLQDTVLHQLDSMVYTIADADGNPVAGIPVSFAIAGTPTGAAGHALTTTLTLSDSLGRASSILTLGNLAGTYVVLVSSDSLGGAIDTLTFTAEAAPASLLARVSGSGQQNRVMNLLDSLFIARLTDEFGNAAVGVPVNFSIVAQPDSATGQYLSRIADTSDASGFVSTQLFLGRKTGTYEVEAASPLLPDSTVRFSVVATHGDAGSFTGDAPAVRDTVGSITPPMLVTLADVFANPIPNATVRFNLEVPSGATGQWLSADTLVTDSLGQAMIILHFGDKAGVYEVSARSDLLPGQSVVFRPTATAARPELMVEFEKPIVPRPILTRLDTSFTTRVTDRYGNPVAGVPVAFVIVDTPATAAGHELSKYQDTTNADGRAWTNLTLGLKTGMYRVHATASGLSNVVFEAVALPGEPNTFSMSATDSLLFVGQTTSPIAVTVVDTGGNLVPDRVVNFAIIGAPAGSAGHALTASNDTTDALGRASTSLITGNRSGTFTIAATVENLPSEYVTIEALSPTGNPNLDTRVDIADLTAIIDHILGRVPLTGIAFTAADVDSNGVINIIDALLTENYLLSSGTWVEADSVIESSTPRVRRSVPVTEALYGMTSLPEPASLVAGDAPDVGSAMNTKANLEFTNLGVRVNLTNDIPVKGLQIFLRLKRPAVPTSSFLKFIRSAHMRIIMRFDGAEIIALAYNFENVPIDTGTGAIMRLPMGGLDTTDVDSIAIIVSSGSTNTSTEIDQQNIVATPVEYPTTYVLYQNYPNPFNAQTTIEYDIPELDRDVARVSIQIFNLLGERVMTIDRGERDAGRYRVIWNGRDEYGATLASGAYFYRLVSLDTDNRAVFNSTKKMIYLK